MLATQVRSEQRKPTRCDLCGTKMVFGEEILKSIDGRSVYLKYICPRRGQEPGCGQIKHIRFSRDDARLKDIDINTFIPA